MIPPSRPEWVASSDRLSAPRVYLILALLFGFATMLATPPFQAPDEYEHFFRIFHLSEGNWVATRVNGNAGDPLPLAVLEMAHPGNLPGRSDRKADRTYFTDKFRRLWVDWEEESRQFAYFPHTHLYAPVGYLPQVLATVMGKVINAGPALIFYAAKTVALLTCIALAYAALRTLPRFQWTVALLLLSPTMIFLSGSLSQDGVLLSGAALIAALLVRVNVDPTYPVGRLQKGVLLFLGFILPVAKFVYLPLSAAIPLLLWRRLPGGAERWRFTAAWVVLCVVPAVLWTKLITSVYVLGRHDIPIDPYAQLAYMQENPLGFLLLVGESITIRPGDLYRSLVGVLGWNDTFMPRWFYWGYGGALLLLAAVESAAAKGLRWFSALLLLATSLGTIVAVYAAIYVHWNSPRAGAPIDGIVGRYLYPAFFSFALCLPRLHNLTVPGGFLRGAGIAACAISSVVCLGAVVARYYLAT